MYFTTILKLEDQKEAGCIWAGCLEPQLLGIACQWGINKRNRFAVSFPLSFSPRSEFPRVQQDVKSWELPVCVICEQLQGKPSLHLCWDTPIEPRNGATNQPLLQADQVHDQGGTWTQALKTQEAEMEVVSGDEA